MMLHERGRLFCEYMSSDLTFQKWGQRSQEYSEELHSSPTTPQPAIAVVPGKNRYMVLPIHGELQETRRYTDVIFEDYVTVSHTCCFVSKTFNGYGIDPTLLLYVFFS